MKRFAAAPCVLLLTVVSGCFYELRDEFAECRINCANKWAAKAAWKNAQGACMGISCPHSYKEGFVSGYIAVADGGTGCVPAVPQLSAHNHMRMDRCSESEKMAAWYDGYEMGVMAARNDGMADANRVTTRIPQQPSIDYSSLNHLNSGDATSPTGPTDLDDEPSPQPQIPPAPMLEPAETTGPQTRSQLLEILR